MLQILPILYGVFFFLSTRVSDNLNWFDGFLFFLFSSHLVCFIAFLFFAPYARALVHGTTNTCEYTNYFSRMAWTLLMSMIVGISLLALGFIAISSVIALFDLSSLISESKFYGNWATMSLVLIAPLYFLTQIPLRDSINTRSFDVNKFFSFLVRFVAIPFIYIYFFILYAYTVKVLMNFSDWPKGMISWMVIGFSSFGYLTYIFSAPYETMNRITRVFRTYFPYTVIPQIGMLAYAIGLRINQYDITMNRYFVVIF